MEADEIPEGLEGLDKGIGNIFGKKLKKRKKNSESSERQSRSTQAMHEIQKTQVENIFPSFHKTPLMSLQTLQHKLRTNGRHIM